MPQHIARQSGFDQFSKTLLKKTVAATASSLMWASSGATTLDRVAHVPYRTAMNTRAPATSTFLSAPAAAAGRAYSAWAWYYEFTKARLEFREVITH